MGRKYSYRSEYDRESGEYKYQYEYNYNHKRHELDMNNPADRAKARVGFKVHLFTYISVISFLWVIAFVTGTFWEHPWPVYPMLGWGLGLVGHYFASYQKYEKWLEKEMQKEGHTPPQYVGSPEADDDYLDLNVPKEKVKQPRQSDFI
jgi:2TM domain